MDALQRLAEKMNAKRILTLTVIGGLLAVAVGWHISQKSEQKHFWGGLNPAVFAAETPQDCSAVYSRYQKFLMSQGFAPITRSNDTVSDNPPSFPSPMYQSSRLDRYVKEMGKEKIFLQVDVSENGFFPHLRWDRMGVEGKGEQNALEAAVKLSDWIKTVPERNQVSSAIETCEEYATKLANLTETLGQSTR